MMKVSVIVPIYNVANYLVECLESIDKQNFSEFEIICVEDCSTDDSLEILEEYAYDHPRIKIYRHKQNRGLSAARNTGIKMASGEYIMFVDSDDYLCENAIAEAYQSITERKADIICFCFKEIFEENYEGSHNLIFQKDFDYSETRTGREFFSKAILNNDCIIMACQKIYRRDFLVDNGLWFYEGILHEDNLHSFQAAMASGNTIKLNSKLYVYRRHGNSLSAERAELKAESFKIIFDILARWCVEHYEELSPQEWEGIQLYVKQVYYRYLYTIRQADPEYIPITGNAAQQFLFELSGNRGFIKEYQYVLLSTDQIKQLAKQQCIIVYGAGAAGSEIYDQLKHIGLKIAYFAVGNMDRNPRKIYGIPVVLIDELKEYAGKSMIVLAVTPKYRDGIEELLEDLGFDYIIPLNLKEIV